jgi:hypothetical protein
MTIEVLVKEHSDELIADLIKWATGKAPIDIRFEDLDEDQCAIITLFDYKGDKELSLRLHLNDVYDIHIGHYDDTDEFIEIAEPLSNTQKATLPEKLKKVMKKVLNDESGIRLPGSFLAL